MTGTLSPAEALGQATLAASTAALDRLRAMAGDPLDIATVFAGRAAYEAAAPLLEGLLPDHPLRHVIVSGMSREALVQARKALADEARKVAR
ncbi:hypothetical protein [Roseomonas sp. USHLN139]|uniref:hypothetical protein n=1 Tax=Roseomonas sp. USHLN139 TaxID=3081298 RepID=UPI003B02DE1D